MGKFYRDLMRFRVEKFQFQNASMGIRVYGCSVVRNENMETKTIHALITLGKDKTTQRNPDNEKRFTGCYIIASKVKDSLWDTNSKNRHIVQDQEIIIFY